MSGATGDLGKALRGWRDRMSPEEAGLPSGGVRRAAGLRREELALLAGLSVDYIVRLEQGRSTAPSPQVLSALSRALRLTRAEREHLYVLAGQVAPGHGQVCTHIPPSVRRLIDQLDGAPLSVYDAAWNMRLWNPLFAALYGDPSHERGRERNVVWRQFNNYPSRFRLDPQQKNQFQTALVTDLRAAAARYPADTDLHALVRELRASSPHFADLWDSGVVASHGHHAKSVTHPDVGCFALDCDVLTVPGSDLRIVAYTAAPGSEAAERLKLLSVIGLQNMRSVTHERS